jgi:hypothetical protein
MASPIEAAASDEHATGPSSPPPPLIPPTMKMLIFKSFPDLREFRHPALWVHFPRDENDRPKKDRLRTAELGHGVVAVDDGDGDGDGEEDCLLVQVTGSRGFFAYDCSRSDLRMAEMAISASPPDHGGDDRRTAGVSSVINSSGVSHRPVPAKGIPIPLLVPDRLRDGGVGREVRSLILSTLEGTPIENADPEFNCQTWTELALRGLWKVGVLDDAGFERAVEELIDGIDEAEDDEL